MKGVKRPDWQAYFQSIAELIATRATCPRASVGTVIERENRILTTGYNGSPPGAPHCEDVGCLMIGGHCMRTTHSEVNAVVQAARHGISLEGATAYTTHEPCLGCTKVLITAGIVKIVHAREYRDDNARVLQEKTMIERLHVPFPA